MGVTCPTCGGGVRVVGSDEGTMHYVPVHDEALRARAYCAEFVLYVIAKGIPFRGEADPRRAAEAWLAPEHEGERLSTGDELARTRRLLYRLDAAVNHHERDIADSGGDVDAELYRVRERVLADWAAGRG